MTMLASFLRLQWGGYQADSCRFYSEVTFPENRAAQTCDGHCGPIVKERCRPHIRVGRVFGILHADEAGCSCLTRACWMEETGQTIRTNSSEVGALAHRGLSPLWGACAGIIPRTAPP